MNSTSFPLSLDLSWRTPFPKKKTHCKSWTTYCAQLRLCDAIRQVANISRDSNFLCSAHRIVFLGKKKKKRTTVTFDTEDREPVSNGLQKKPKSIHLSEWPLQCSCGYQDILWQNGQGTSVWRTVKTHTLGRFFKIFWGKASDCLVIHVNSLMLCY